ncbi:MAG TPA: hypothetical protein VGN57_08180 [Pirellulaceae bacterium]|jgi:hypothetical protein|nr:hypothetical protein [Pirellulaceae bacterium]
MKSLRAKPNVVESERSYPPLFVDPAVEALNESERGPVARLLRRALSYFPSFAYYEVPYGLRSVETQLRARREFSEAAWRAEVKDVDLARDVCRIVAKHCFPLLPNVSFVPEDPCSLIFLTSYDQMEIFGVAWELRDRFGVDLLREDLRESRWPERWTMGKLVSYVAFFGVGVADADDAAGCRKASPAEEPRSGSL